MVRLPTLIAALTLAVTVFGCALSPEATPAVAPTATAAPGPSQSALAARSAEMAKFDQPLDHIPKSGPAGTQWDRQYRSFIQTDQDAASKGLPSHADAGQQILADAAQSAEKLQMHKGYVLYIKHFSQAYRPEQATADLKALYASIIDKELGIVWPPPTATPLPFAGDPALRILRDVVYGGDDPQAQRLDAYLVQAARPAPVLIEIHGGGWRRGAKSQFADVYKGDLIGLVLQAGISVVSIDYRLTPGAVWPAQANDVARAVQYVRTQAKAWNIDPARLATLGGSAGAHLGAWVALHDDMADPKSKDGVARQSTRLSCFVDEWGPMDLTRVRPAQLATESLRGEDFSRAYTALFATTLEGYNADPAIQPLLREASPLFLVSAGDPPALIVGAADAALGQASHPPVPAVINDPHSPWHGVLLTDALSAAGVQVVRYLGPDVGKDAGQDNAVILRFLRDCLHVP
jgi:acetyl esterase/lipase